MMLMMNSCKQVSDSESLTQGLEASLSAEQMRGVEQAAALWTEADGSAEEFRAFVETHLCKNDSERLVLFESLSRIMEKCNESADMLTVELLRPTQLTNAGEPATPDWIMSGYSPMAHFTDDMYANKLAFLTILNFPHYTLEEKNSLGRTWTRQEWAFARLGDVFTTRVPGAVKAQVAQAHADAENYIADYNIYMGNLRTDDGRQLWPEDKILLSHWNLRDELKAQYNVQGDKVQGTREGDKVQGTRDMVQSTRDNVQSTRDKVQGTKENVEKQEMIYKVMQRIVRQEIPQAAINNPDYIWKPYEESESVKAKSEREPYTRYAHILQTAKAYFAEDAYCPAAPTAIQRNFEEGMEIPAEELDSLFRVLLGSEQVQQVASVIRERLGRELRPYDIWYDGFKARASLNEDDLSAKTRRLYPDANAFAADMWRLMTRMGFYSEDARNIAHRIAVEPARGSGHAWPCLGRKEDARLRTRIAPTGMDYKGYNIAVHEFGHCVEQILDMYYIDYYMLSGVPNTAYTEASAFLWQQRDLKLMPGNTEPLSGAMTKEAVFDQFWSMYEIMGVSIVDMSVWRWIYDHPKATPKQLCEATIAIAQEVWNTYYEPVLGEHDCELLGIYSHMVDVPMYLPNYPLGHIVQFQIEEHLSQYTEPRDFALEYMRIYRLGRLTPKEWMLQAVGAAPSVEPVLQAVTKALQP